MSSSFERGLVTFLRVVEALQNAPYLKSSLSFCQSWRCYGLCSCERYELCQMALAEYLGVSKEAVRQLLDKLKCRNFSFFGFRLYVRYGDRRKGPYKFLGVHIDNKVFLEYEKRISNLMSENESLRNELDSLKRKLSSYERSLRSLRMRLNRSQKCGYFKLRSEILDRINSSGDRAYISVFERNPHLLGLPYFLSAFSCSSLLDLAKLFDVDLDDVLLALGALRKAGVIKDVKFV